MFFFSELTPFTEYEFQVLAVNKIGMGPPSDPAYVTTGETGKILLYYLYYFIQDIQDIYTNFKNCMLK